MLKIDFYKNKRSGDENLGKVYARVKANKMIGIDELADHIAEHGSPYTADVIHGVLKAIAKCTRELVLGGTPVKIDNLCIFRPAISANPANDVETFDLSIDSTGNGAGNIKSVRMQCRPTGKSVPKLMTAAAQIGYTSLAQRIKNGEAILSSRKGEYLASGSGSGSGGGNTEPVVNP